jgi:hypothetical protein
LIYSLTNQFSDNVFDEFIEDIEIPVPKLTEENKSIYEGANYRRRMSEKYQVGEK